MFQPLLFTEAHRQKFQRSRGHQTVQQFKRFIENYRRHIGCVAVFYTIAAGLFLERAYCACWPRGGDRAHKNREPWGRGLLD